MKSEQAFALEHAEWPALLVDGSGIIRRANQAAVGVFGQAVEREPSLAASIWSPENDAKPEQFLAHFDRTAESTHLLRLRVKGGVGQPFTVRVCPLIRDGQRLYIFQCHKATPSAAGPTAAPGADAAQIQQQKLECAMQLARSVALDFNNALTSILGYTSLILSRLEPTNPWRQSLLEVEKSAERAAEIADHLATFSRQEKDISALANSDLNLVLQRTVDSFRASAGERIRWEVRLESRIHSTQLDEAKIQQAFAKVLENCVEAIAEQGHILVATRNLVVSELMMDGAAQVAPGHYVVVEIADNGCGIEPPVLRRVFEPFFTTKKSTKHRGLGLAWVYGIVTNHGGSVAISSTPAQGTSLRLYLPAQQKTILSGAGNDDDLMGDATILMVDDDELLLAMGETVLSAFGYRVMTATGGAKALEILSAGLPIDLVLTDLVMPGMSGRELVAHVRQFSPQVRIICSSGFLRAGQVAEDELYLQKPYTTQDLLRKVKQALIPQQQAN